MEEIKSYIKINNLSKSSPFYSRKVEHSFQRFYLMKYLRLHYYSLNDIGNFFGLSHATVINGINQYEILKGYDDFIEITNEVSRLFPLDKSFKINQQRQVESLLFCEKLIQSKL